MLVRTTGNEVEETTGGEKFHTGQPIQSNGIPSEASKWVESTGNKEIESWHWVMPDLKCIRNTEKEL